MAGTIEFYKESVGSYISIPKPNYLDGAPDDVLTTYAGLFLDSAGKLPKPDNNGIINLTDTKTSKVSVPLSGHDLIVTLPSSIDMENESNRKLAEYAARPGVSQARTDDYLSDVAKLSKNAYGGPFDFAKELGKQSVIAGKVFGGSALGEVQQLGTGLQQILTTDPKREKELQFEADVRQEKIHEATRDNPALGFAGSLAPYFLPFGFAARGATNLPGMLNILSGTLGKTAGASNVIGRYGRKANKFGHDLTKAPFNESPNLLSSGVAIQAASKIPRMVGAAANPLNNAASKLSAVATRYPGATGSNLLKKGSDAYASATHGLPLVKGLNTVARTVSNSPAAQAAALGAAEGWVHPMQGPISGAAMAFLGNQAGRKFADRFGIERTTDAPISKEREETIKYARKNNIPLDTASQTGGNIDKQRRVRTVYRPATASVYEEKIVPQAREQITKSALRDIAGKGGMDKKLIEEIKSLEYKNLLPKGTLKKIQADDAGKELRRLVNQGDISEDSLKKIEEKAENSFNEYANIIPERFGGEPQRKMIEERYGIKLGQNPVTDTLENRAPGLFTMYRKEKTLPSYKVSGDYSSIDLNKYIRDELVKRGDLLDGIRHIRKNLDTDGLLDLKKFSSLKTFPEYKIPDNYRLKEGVSNRNLPGDPLHQSADVSREFLSGAPGYLADADSAYAAAPPDIVGAMGKGITRGGWDDMKAELFLRGIGASAAPVGTFGYLGRGYGLSGNNESPRKYYNMYLGGVRDTMESIFPHEISQ